MADSAAPIDRTRTVTIPLPLGEGQGGVTLLPRSQPSERGLFYWVCGIGRMVTLAAEKGDEERRVKAYAQVYDIIAHFVYFQSATVVAYFVYSA